MKLNAYQWKYEPIRVLCRQIRRKNYQQRYFKLYERAHHRTFSFRSVMITADLQITFKHQQFCSESACIC